MTPFDALPDDTFRDWLVEQRWFASKTQDVASLNVLERVPLRSEAPLLELALVEARFPFGTHELYQVPLGARPADEGWSDRVIAQVGEWTVYDALADAPLGRELLHLMRAGRDARTEEGTVHFRFAADAPAATGATVDVRPVGVEQSNSSIVFGENLILKAFRKVEPGPNPELEILRFLSERGFPNIPSLAGWYEYEGKLLDATLGILQEFLAGGRDGFELAVSDPAGFEPQAQALGEVTGSMHTVLGSDASDPHFVPEEPSQEGLSLLVATVDEQIERGFLDLPPDDERVAPILGRGEDIRELLKALANIGIGGRIIRTHGDYHLGQTMLTERGWVILDFEGEPARPLPERRRKRSPLRDVAGMLRSFSYAASVAEQQHGIEPPEGWVERVRESFLAGYFDTVDPALLPPGREAIQKLLAIFELEKVIYELRYELDNRPDWVGIPVAGIQRLLQEELA
jgi:predicted trehalose synthase